ncbi:hypothetical protein J7E88_05940 [Streptomyces sp. ISL-10]|nr:hypothetical protein [Streptomyces sp. ISL-10]
MFAATVPQAEPKPVGPGRRRRLLTVVLPSVLILGLIGGGITYTGITVAGADRSAPTVAWEAPDPDAAGEDPALGAARGRASTPLSKLLLPVPRGFRLGPDIQSYGNDGELGEHEAVALLKEEAQGRGLSGKKGRDYRKSIDKLGIQGIAVRSFASEDNDLVVEVRVVRMKNKRRLADMHDLSAEVFEFLEFPMGPKIKDHKKSSCFLMPKAPDEDRESDKEENLDGMFCSAYDSELLVNVSAVGARPFDKAAVADLVKDQLDHIESPGEYI